MHCRRHWVPKRVQAATQIERPPQHLLHDLLRHASSLLTVITEHHRHTPCSLRASLFSTAAIACWCHAHQLAQRWQPAGVRWQASICAEDEVEVICCRRCSRDPLPPVHGVCSAQAAALRTAARMRPVCQHIMKAACPAADLQATCTSSPGQATAAATHSTRVMHTRTGFCKRAQMPTASNQHPSPAAVAQHAHTPDRACTALTPGFLLLWA